MSRRRGATVRMGPVSIFTLVIVLCLAVLAVLALTTARSSMALAERQAAFTVDDYANEAVAQELLARVSAVAEGAGDAGEALDELAAQLPAMVKELSSSDGPAVSAELLGSTVAAHVQSESGRALDATLEVTEDGAVRATSWMATTLWSEDTGDVLWTGDNQH